MVATGVAVFAAASTLVFGVGLLFAFRTDAVVTFQETFVGAASVAPPDADAGEARAWRRRTLRVAGLAMTAVGGLGLAAVGLAVA
jgi:hypothetical protein